MDLCCLEFVVGIFSIFISSVKTVLTKASTLDFSVTSNQHTVSTTFLKVVRFHIVHVLGVVFSPMGGMDGILISDSTFRAPKESCLRQQWSPSGVMGDGVDHPCDGTFDLNTQPMDVDQLSVLIQKWPARIAGVTRFTDLSNIWGSCHVMIGVFRRTGCVHLTIYLWLGPSNRFWVCSLYGCHFSVVVLYSTWPLDTSIRYNGNWNTIEWRKQSEG